MESWLLCIEKLKELLDAREDLTKALTDAIQKAGFPEIQNLGDYFLFLERMLTEIPTRRQMSPATERFHYIVNCSPGGLLQKDDDFQQWLVAFSKDHGSFLDTTASAKALDTFISDPEYHIREYDPGPSGWLTFNQFFARKVKPGQRPVTAPCNDNVIVSAADSVYLGCWPIDERAKLTVKGQSWTISQLLHGSSWHEKFAGGVFTHSYLDTNDYHRFHVPVAGMVREAKVIPGRVFVEEVKDKEGRLTTKDDIGFQFRQTRGILILESAVGYVAVIPVGMGHVSSVNITAEPGVSLVKGEEFGYFSYGGSDMVLLFQHGKIEFTARPGMHYKQGEQIAVTSPSSKDL
jgi:phosphatidylserine decarboxylase